MVPSWTETLLNAGVEVVGRTRFCIHPTSVRGVPRVGGTKDWNLAQVLGLKADLLILDEQENPKWMASRTAVPVWASHVGGIEHMPGQLAELADLLENPNLMSLARRWELVSACPPVHGELPGVLEWGRRAEGPITSVLYLTWRDPWMSVGPQTFIGSVLHKVGYPVYPFEERYPEVNLADFDPATTLLLFSSEPYPFMRKREGIAELGFPYAFVDGECFSWFGVRALEFLEGVLSLGKAEPEITHSP